MEDRELLELLRGMVQVASPYFHEAEVMDYCAAWLEARGLPVQRQHYTEDKLTGYHGENLVCTLEGEADGPVIVLNGHLDTVQLCEGWTREPYGAAIEGERLYGVGAVDMKGGCAALMVAFARLARLRRRRRGTVILTLVSDEEGPWGLGCDALLSSGLLPARVDCSICCEPSAAFCGVADAPVICTGAKGNYVMQAEFFGRAAHASQPERGVNAAIEAGKFLAAVRQPETDGALGRGAICVLKVEADGGACSVPDRAKVTWNRHLNEREDEQTLLDEAERFLREGGVKCPCKIDVRPYPTPTTRGYPPYAVAPDDPWLQKLRRAVRETCGCEPVERIFDSIGDFNYLAVRLGAPCLLLGPAGGNFHSADEWVSLPSLAQVERSIAAFLDDAV